MGNFLRHNKTGLYYAGENCWVGDPALALAFERKERAAELKWEDALPETEIVPSHEARIFEHFLPLPVSM